MQYRRNVTHVKKFLESENLKPKAKSSDATGDRDLAAKPESQVFKVPADASNRPTEQVNPSKCKQADSTLAQSDSISSSLPSRVRKLDIKIMFWDVLGLTQNRTVIELLFNWTVC